MRLGSLLCLLVLLLFPRTSLACGFVSSPRMVGEPPSAAHEDVLIIYDSATETEHFIRRVRFSNAAATFGFIVPTPSLPTVHEAPDAIWSRLEERCPHHLGSSAPQARSVTGTGQGFGAGHGRLGGSAGGVTVLSRKKLGDFSAFVLAASDTRAFDSWLEQHRFAVTPAMREWLDGYVKLGFHFVALRYDGGKQAVEGALESKTVRISFRTPNPYYPYREPEDTKDDKERKLLLWLASSELMLPVAGVIEGEKTSLRRPFSESMPCSLAAAAVLADADKAIERLVPAGASMQAFVDLKSNRTFWGDALFTPVQAHACGEGCVKERLRLLPLLNPRVGQAPEIAPAALALGDDPAPRTPPPSAPVASASPAAPAAPSAAATASTSAPARGCALSLGGAGHARPGALLGLSLLALAWRRRQRLLLALLLLVSFTACKTRTEQTAPSPPPAPPPSSKAQPTRTSNDLPEVPFRLPVDASELRRALLELLAGHRNGELIEVWSQPKQGGLGAIEIAGPEGFHDRKTVQELCVRDPRVEGVLRYEVSFFEGKAQAASLSGAFSPGVLDCARGLLLEAAWMDPEDSRPVVRGFYGFGSTASEIQPYRRRLEKHLSLMPSTAYRVPGRYATPKVRMGATQIQGALPPEVISRIVRQNYGRFRLCYEQGLARNPNLEGRVGVSFVIDQQGAVKDPKSSKSDLRDKAVVDCVVRSFYGLSFPPPERGLVTVHYPIMLSPG